MSSIKYREELILQLLAFNASCIHKANVAVQFWKSLLIYFIRHHCVCVYIYLCVIFALHMYTKIHNGSVSSSRRDQYENSCITHHIGPLWWMLRQP